MKQVMKSKRAEMNPTKDIMMLSITIKQQTYHLHQVSPLWHKMTLRSSLPRLSQ